MEVRARGPGEGGVTVQAILPPQVALPLGQFLVECGPQHRLGGIHIGIQFAIYRDGFICDPICHGIASRDGGLCPRHRIYGQGHIGDVQADGGIAAGTLREGDGWHGLDQPSALGHHAAHLVDGQTIQDLRPTFVIIGFPSEAGHVFHSLGGKALVHGIQRGQIHVADLLGLRPGLGVAPFPVLITLGIIQRADHVWRSFQLDGFWIGALPVGTAEIGDCPGLPAIQVGLGEGVGHHRTCIHTVLIGFCIKGIHGPLVGKSGIPFHCRALGRKDIVHCLMGTVADGEIVIPGIQDIAFRFGVIVRRQPLEVDRHCNSFAPARFQQSGLFKAH